MSNLTERTKLDPVTNKAITVELTEEEIAALVETSDEKPSKSSK
jgi:hypothetical protein